MTSPDHNLTASSALERRSQPIDYRALAVYVQRQFPIVMARLAQCEQAPPSSAEQTPAKFPG